MEDHSPIALISVTDKTGLIPFATKLSQKGFQILSTGGTAKILRDAGITVFDVAQYAGSPEILDGRVKTLHPKIHGGILMDRELPEHVREASDHGILPIDLVVVNLYQFASEAADKNLQPADAIHFIDVGGPTMLRAAAKNFKHCAAVVDPSDYEQVLAELSGERLSMDFRQCLAAKVFRLTSAYDALIAETLTSNGSEKITEFPETLAKSWHKKSVLRYGENPQQSAAFYQNDQEGLGDAKILQGKALSYNNYIDIDAACQIVRDLNPMRAISIVKHTNPCGVAASAEADLSQIFSRAFAADSKSAFGGIVALNSPVDEATAAAMSEIFLECIAAPAFTEQALAILGRKKNLRLLQLSWLDQPETKSQTLRSVTGGVLVQDSDTAKPDRPDAWQTPTRLSVKDYTAELSFAMTVAKHVKSNAIVFTNNLTTLAVGAGQMSRIDALQFASQKAEEFGHSLKGAVMASDAFFPFRDCVDFAAKLGIKAIIQPGGSKRDSESIAACDEHGIAMAVTGVRHFKH